MDRPDITELVEQLGGVATRAQLEDVVGRTALGAALRTGVLERIGHGRYALPGLQADLRAARSVGGVLGGLSAARHWAWSVKRKPRKPVVIVPRNRPLKSSELAVRRRDLEDEWIAGGVALTKVQTVVDCARTLPFDEALCVADAALRDGVERGLLVEAAQSSPRTGRPVTLEVVHAADGRAAARSRP